MMKFFTGCEEPQEDSCRRAYQRLERAVRGSNDGLWDWDLLTDKVWYAPQFLEMLELSRDEFADSLDSWTSRLHPDDYQPTWDAMQRHLLDRAEYNVKFRLLNKSGDYHWFRARGTAYLDEAGVPVGMAGSIRNIDEFVEAEKKLRIKEKQLIHQQKLDALGSLASGIAHEFNNILQIMRGYTQFALESLSGDHPAKKDLDRVLDAEERASVLTRQMLDFSRAEEADAQPHRIDEVIEEFANMVSPLLPDGIDLRLELNASTACVLIDPPQLKQALLNLCLNARDAMPDGGILRIQSEMVSLTEEYVETRPNLHPGDCVRVTVADSGSGVPPGAIERIFEPFYTTREVGKGTGLGLAVTFGVIQQANGHIECSRETKHGAKFIAHLPTCVSSASSLNTAAAQHLTENLTV